MRDLLEALCRASAELQRLHKQAIDARRRDIATEIREASFCIADAIALTVPDRAKEAS